MLSGDEVQALLNKLGHKLNSSKLAKVMEEYDKDQWAPEPNAHHKCCCCCCCSSLGRTIAGLDPHRPAPSRHAAVQMCTIDAAQARHSVM